ncbi:uncharacterized protein LOC106079773 isoform X1 [Biomphalaria glabrata]|uniref:Uncharacterized protein LOC106079773 isoform X1 n=1 Tax=Biomphalaria glabrata TaxID=6526 RepID=A0A9W2YTS4_BIOGL|nr:uncharacterized protein LOC106079773 isoform X1 [Biomphalaria glabrata]XP_055866199.1 uncharacterized protein LOC106079773 isoform X1 [Biomphalaria glabrata]
MAGSRCLQNVGISLFLVCWLLEKSSSQDITLELQTHGCSHGLLTKRHNIDFTSVVHLGEEIENFSMAVVFVISMTNNEIYHLVAQLDDCGIDQTPCRCFSRETSYRIKCSMPAEKPYSEATVYAYISNLSGKKFNSETRRIPTIYDEGDLHLSVNGQSLDSNCILPINEKTRALTFCSGNGPAPLTAVIYRNSVLVASSATCANYEHPSLDNSPYQLVVYVCQDRTPVMNRTCLTQDSATNVSSYVSTMNITLFVLVIMTLWLITS